MSRYEASEALELGSGSYPPLTHRLFRYPAKFYPPAVATLIERHTDPGDLILDPFVGSGTALVECAARGRPSVGLDVDPVATLISSAKTRLYDLDNLRTCVTRIASELKSLERTDDEYRDFQFTDIGQHQVKSELEKDGLEAPAIPNLFHWFRGYVVVDLARLQRTIDLCTAATADTALFLRAVFGSIIRNCSNADPVPVSGLEYTIHMRRRDAAGRIINPFHAYRAALTRAVKSVESFQAAVSVVVPPLVFTGSATSLPDEVPEVNAVITSPPYHNAVDYYRRHQLEMFWLRLTKSHEERLELLPGYIGRPRIPRKDPILALPWNPTPRVDEWESRIRLQSAQRANDFRHYMQSMGHAFEQLASRLATGAPALLIVGNSSWNGDRIPTAELFVELAGDHFHYQRLLSYPVKNRYMSYTRHNGASIDHEYVVVLKRT